MSFIVNKVKVRNFRSHDSFSFEADPHGVTVIKGRNGTGKSTLVDSIAWCLYGIKPHGVTKNQDLKRKTAASGDPCYVEVDVTVPSGDVYRVQRRILSRSNSECDVWQVVGNVNDDGNEDSTDSSDETTTADTAGAVDSVNNADNADSADNGDDTAGAIVSEDGSVLLHCAGASVKNATAFVRDVLEVNEKGFLASIFVQQKQVDALLTASPKERGAVIEKMTGIQALTEAVSEIRSELNDAKKAVEFLSRDKGEDEIDVEAIKLEISESEEKISLLEASAIRAEESLEEKDEEHSQLRKVLDKIETWREESRKNDSREARIADRRESASTQKSSLERTLESVRNEISAEVEKYSKFKGGTSSSLISVSTAHLLLEQVQEERAILRLEIDELTSQQSKVDSKIAVAKEKMSEKNKYQALFSERGIDLSGSLFTAENCEKYAQELREEFESYTSDLTQLNSSINDSRERLSQLRFENESSKAVVAALGGETHQCPTCRQTPDNAESIVSEHKESMERNEKEIEQLSSMLSESQEQLSTLEQLSNTLSEASSSLSRLSEVIPEALTLKANRKSVKESLGRKNVRLSVVEKQIPSLRDVISLDKRAQSIERQISECEETLKSCDKYDSQLEAARTKVAQVFEELPSEDEVEYEMGKVSDFVDSTRDSLYSMRTEIEKLRKDIEFSDRELARAAREEKEYKKALSKLESLTASFNLVSSFREERIDSVIPEISFVASDFLQRFTDGKFVGVELSSNYRASVELATGQKRDVGLLSGGELSAVALALRLAIASISHTSDNGVSTMILDEVLVSQDENRVENIVTTIKESMDGQVILIGHNGEAITSIADRVVDLSEKIGEEEDEAVA